jgi:hypothetical protein
VPAQDGLWFHQQDRLSPPTDQPGEKDQKRTLVSREVGTPGRPRGDDELLTQESVLDDEFLARAGCVEKCSHDDRGRAHRNVHSRSDPGDHLAGSGTDALNERGEHVPLLHDQGATFKSCTNHIPQRSCGGRDK